MRRPTFRRTHGGMALFPFLAVLICTMGALIVLLVMILHQANAHAASIQAASMQAAIAQQAESDSMVATDQDAARELQETVDKLRELREEQARRVADARLALGHLEDHLRDLEDRGTQLQAQLKALTDSSSHQTQDIEQIQSQIATMKQRIAAVSAELKRTREEARGRPKSYSLIAYEGPNGTRRRPIYIECSEEGISLRPENLLLMEQDFAGQLGSGNPLDACLRAVREYLSAQGPSNDGEPYPLLVVRPSGVLNYSLARAAMKSWENEFGYELLDEETMLEYPPADPELERILIKTLADAKQRQQTLAQAMPSRFRGGATAFGASSSGGFEPITNDGERGAAGRGSGFFPGTSAANAAGTSRNNMGRGANPSATPSDSSTGSQSRSMNSAANKSSQGSATANEAQTANNRQNSKTGERGTLGSSNGSQGAGQGAGQVAAQGGPSRASGGVQGEMGLSPIAGSRGTDWALPRHAVSSTAITRPVRIQLYKDRLMIIPERGEKQRSRTVPFTSENMTNEIETFVTQVWQHTEGWGLAVVNGYWKPVLRVEVAPDAEEQYVELRRLMSGSGLDVERKK